MKCMLDAAATKGTQKLALVRVPTSLTHILVGASNSTDVRELSHFVHVLVVSSLLL